MSQHIYDYAIIGSGLSGLITAARLSAETENIVLLEGADQFGGWNRPISFPSGLTNNGLRSLPDQPAVRQALDSLENFLGLKLMGETEEVPPVTYAEGQLREFLGFGDQPPEFYDLLQPFLESRRLPLKLEPYAWTELLWQKFRGNFMTRSFVTKIVVENSQVSHILVNGAKQVRAHQYIYCGTIKQLATLLPSEILGAKARQKLAKTSYWTALCLDLCHPTPISDSPAIHVLNGTTVDEIGPCVGIFHPPGEGNLQASQWMTFLDEDVTEDSETVGQALKKIKRQIKRAYPQALDGIVRERIVVVPLVAGTGDLKVTDSQRLLTVENLWLGSSALPEMPGVSGALEQSRRVLAAMGFGENRPADQDAGEEAIPASI